MKYASNEEMKQMILRAAETVFGKKGYENTNLQDIADEMKISRGPLYYYFKNKETLYLETLKFHFDREFNTYQALFSQDISLWEMVRLKLQFAARNTHGDACDTFTDTHSGLSKDMIHIIRSHYERIYRLEQDRFGEKLREMNIGREEDIEKFVKLLIVVYEGTESLVTKKHMLINSDDADEISDFLIDIFKDHYHKGN